MANFFKRHPADKPRATASQRIVNRRTIISADNSDVHVQRECTYDGENWFPLVVDALPVTLCVATPAQPPSLTEFYDEWHGRSHVRRIDLTRHRDPSCTNREADWCTGMACPVCYPRTQALRVQDIEDILPRSY